jgi:hypothetical protein
MPYETITLAISPSSLELGAATLEHVGKNGSVHETLNVWEGKRERGIVITCEQAVDSDRAEWLDAIAMAHEEQDDRPRWIHVTNLVNGSTEYWDVQERQEI